MIEEQNMAKVEAIEAQGSMMPEEPMEIAQDEMSGDATMEPEEEPVREVKRMTIRDDMTPDEVMKLAEKKGMAEFLRTIGQSAARFQY